MKTIRLLYPDHVSGGLSTYYLGARLLSLLVPENKNQKTLRVAVQPPDTTEKPVTHGITGEADVLHGIRDARAKIEAEAPGRIITLGGNCLVSLAPFDYLHGTYDNVGILWIDAHPDVSTPEDGYPFAHAMVLGSLLGGGAASLRKEIKHDFFRADQVLYVGLQPIHDYQEQFLKTRGVAYTIQDKSLLPDAEILAFLRKFDHILVHFDIDSLSERLFSDTYFANKDLVGDGTGGGKMDFSQLSHVLTLAASHADVVGFTIAEYLPFSAERLQRLLGTLPIFKDKDD